MEDLSGAFVENNALFVIPDVRERVFVYIPNVDYNYWLLTLLSMFQRLTVFLYYVRKYSIRIFNGVYRGIADDEYAFHRGSNTAFSLYKLKSESAAAASLEWIYSTDKKQFKNIIASPEDELHYFPYLSAEVYHGNLRLYDISEFVSELKWTACQGAERPTAKHILAAWSLETGIVLDVSLSLSLHVITETGDEEVILLAD
jgi:hypothetical protein